MKVSKIFFIIVIVCLLQIPLTAQSNAAEAAKKPELYVTAREAYDRWKAQPEEIKIIDVRTPEEYTLIGHPPMAHNIPFLLFNGNWYAGTKGEGAQRPQTMVPNRDFIAQVKKKFKPEDTLFLMCRSGGRSAMAVNALAKEGFKKVYSITDGFEGGTVKDRNNYYYGKRMINGWKNAGAPWTYKVEPELAFSSVYSN